MSRLLLLLLVAFGATACRPSAGAPPQMEEVLPTRDSADQPSGWPNGTAADTLPPAIAARLREVQRPPRSTRWDDAPLEELVRSPGHDESVCVRFARRVAEFALRHPDSPPSFLEALQREVVGGTSDPFELERGLREGRWNQEYFYPGHGGFRREFDDAQRYSGGGNHQPGHLVAVLSIAARYGETAALIALAQAGDYDPGEEDDLRLSLEAIEMGVGMTQGTLAPADLARRVRGLCR